MGGKAGQFIKRRVENGIQFPIYTSIAQASAATKIPVAVFRLAKAQGCPAFVHCRVYIGPFLEWWFTREHPQEEAEQDWAKALKREQTLRTRQLREREQGLLIEASAVQEGIARGMAQLFGALDRVFTSEFPAMAKGRSEVEIRDAAIAQLEAVKDRLRESLSSVESFGGSVAVPAAGEEDNEEEQET